jgi:hypothetical protein
MNSSWLAALSAIEAIDPLDGMLLKRALVTRGALAIDWFDGEVWNDPGGKL